MGGRGNLASEQIAIITSTRTTGRPFGFRQVSKIDLRPSWNVCERG
tara:strand:+ start:43 stop:180 length:138 start_codon:yes stop_codon:yes gene_type:complete